MKKIFLLMFVMVFLIGSVNALEWDNVKQYNEETKTVEIKNSLLGISWLSYGEVAEIKLNTELNHYVIAGKNRMVGEFTINNYDTYSNVFKKMELFNVKKNMKEFERDFTYKYQKSIGFETVDITKRVCEKYKDDKGGDVSSCRAIPTGETKQVEKFEWAELDLKELPKGEITVGIFTDVSVGERVEWIPTFFGVRINEWAEWTEGLNIDLKSYWTMDDTSYMDNVSNNNLTETANMGNIGGHIGNAINKTSTGAGVRAINTSSLSLPKASDNTNWTHNMWFYHTAGTSNSLVWGFSVNTENWGGSNNGNMLGIDGGWKYFANGGTSVSFGTDYFYGTWEMITITYDDANTNVSMYRNGTLYNYDTISDVSDGDDVFVGSNVYGYELAGLLGAFDEVGIWSRKLSDAEITQLYNGGSGMTYVDTFDNPPTSTLNEPVNDATVFLSTISFNGTGTDDTAIQNMSLYVNESLQVTNSSPLNNTLTDFSHTFSEAGLYNWTIEVCDEAGVCVNATSRNITYQNDLTITLNDPINAFNSTSQTIIFNGTGSDDTTLQNMSYILNGSYNGTNSSPINNSLTQFPRTLADGFYNWTIEVCDEVGACINATPRNFSIDSNVPFVNITQPFGTLDFGETGGNFTFNASSTDDNLNTCWYDYEFTNTTYTCNTDTINITISTGRNITAWANDSIGNENSSQSIFIYRIFVNNQSFTTSLLEGISSIFSINIDTNGTDITIGNLSYNGTENIGTIVQNTNNFNISKTIVAPSVDVDTNISFFWNITQGDGVITIANTTPQNQTILNLDVDNCSINTNTLYNFSIVDEASQSLIITPLTENTTGRVDLNIFDSTGTIKIENFSQFYNTTNPFGVCFNSTMSSGDEYLIEVQVEYDADSHEKEFYNIQNDTITTDDFPTNITLYDLLTTSSQTFKIIFKDSSFLPVVDALIQIQRKYIDEGVFRTVEIPKTDVNGETLGHFVLDDIIYTLIVIKNGETLGTFNNVKVVCQNPSLENCEMPLNAVTTTIQPEDFTVLDDFTFTLSYNQTSRVIESIYTIPSSTVGTVLLNATLFDSLGNTTVCTDTVVSSSGTLQCIVPSNFGNATIIAKISKDGTLQGQGTIKIDQQASDLFGANLMFLTLFLYMTLIGVAISNNPMITGVFLMIGAILGISLNMVDSTGFIGVGATVLWLFIAVIIVLIKGAKRG